MIYIANSGLCKHKRMQRRNMAQKHYRCLACLILKLGSSARDATVLRTSSRQSFKTWKRSRNGCAKNDVWQVLKVLKCMWLCCKLWSSMFANQEKESKKGVRNGKGKETSQAKGKEKGKDKGKEKGDKGKELGKGKGKELGKGKGKEQGKGKEIKGNWRSRGCWSIGRPGDAWES